MSARGWASLVVVLACCCASSTVAPAAAQRAQPAVVASDGPATLSAFDDGGTLCLAAAAPDDATSCGDPAEGIRVVGSDGQKRYVGVAIMPGALRVEVRRAGVLLGAAPTTRSSSSPTSAVPPRACSTAWSTRRCSV